MNILGNTRRKRQLSKSLILDGNIPASQQMRVDNGEILLQDGVSLALSQADKKKVIYSKLESTNPEATDMMHPNGEWRECGVSHHMVSLIGNEEREELGMTMDDGVMMWFLGTAEEEVAIDPITRRVLPLEDAEQEEELSGQHYPRYIRFDFRLEEAKITDGPERRISLHDDAEKQRAKSESATNNKLGAVLEGILEKMNGMGEPAPVVDGGDPLDTLIASGMNMDQIKAAMEMKIAEKEAPVITEEVAIESVGEDESAVTYKKTKTKGK